MPFSKFDYVSTKPDVLSELKFDIINPFHVTGLSIPPENIRKLLIC